MRFLGNFIWFICGGLFGGIAWLFYGLLWSLTIIGLPIGIQCFKIAQLSFWPFGRDVVYSQQPFSFLINLIWLLFCGLPLAIAHLLSALLLCLTIVGIPFALQSFKLAKLSLMPFGAEIVVLR